jgi:biopolymer transport protein ExbD
MDEINITPFTDVCLVLMIIFMVTATFLNTTPGVDLDLPDITRADVDAAPDITISLSREGRVFVNSQETTFAELSGVLLPYAQKNTGQLVVVQGDQDVPYGLVMKVMDASRLVGLTNVALAAEEQPPEEQGEAAGKP